MRKSAVHLWDLRENGGLFRTDFTQMTFSLGPLKTQVQTFCIPMNIHITSALPQHRPGLEALLMANDLPVSDLPVSLNGFFLAMDGEAIVGAAGMEQYGETGLLRSVAVAQSHRNRHIARQLTDTVLSQARKEQVRVMYLITTAADRYFEKYGFQRVDRSEVPASIAQTEQFAELCPSSAVVMKLALLYATENGLRKKSSENH